LGQKPELSSHATAKKPASVGYAADVETVEEADLLPKPALAGGPLKFDMDAWKVRQAKMLADTQASLDLARKTQELERARIAQSEADKAAKAAQIKAELDARAAAAAAAKAAAEAEASAAAAQRLREEAAATQAAHAAQEAEQAAGRAAAAERAAAEVAAAAKEAEAVRGCPNPVGVLDCGEL
jgi:hypothetical protein